MHTLYVIGLGSGAQNSLQILEEERFAGVVTCIFHAMPAHLKEYLQKRSLKIVNLEDLLPGNRQQSFEGLERKTAKFILEIAAKEGSALLFLPGRPWGGEALIRNLNLQIDQQRFSLQLIPGTDVWPSVFNFLSEHSLAENFSRGLTLIDAHSLEELKDPPGGDLLITHPCSNALIALIKRCLLKFYPSQHKINIMQFTGRGNLSLLHSQPLGKIEELGPFHCWTFLHLSPSSQYSLGDMAHLMEQLRSAKGCPWDRQQDHLSLRPYLLEEAYEVLGAINSASPQALCEELGDLLLQIIFHSQLASEKREFSLWQVIDGLARKIYRRHPHVFQDEKINSARDVRLRWQEIKREEKGEKGEGKPGEMFNLPAELPALMKAQKIQKRAADLGFDWPDINGALDKLSEEVGELINAYRAGNKLKIEEEIGDLFFALVNIARFLKVEAELALNLTVEKFRQRFRYIEEQVQLRGGDFSKFSLAELDYWWEEAKKLES